MDIPLFFFFLFPKSLTKEVFSVLALRLEIPKHFLNKEHVHFSWSFLLFARYSRLHCGVLTKLLLLPAVGPDLQVKLECSWLVWLPIHGHGGEPWAVPMYNTCYDGGALKCPFILHLKPRVLFLIPKDTLQSNSQEKPKTPAGLVLFTTRI